MSGNKTQTIKKVVNLHSVPDDKFFVMLQKTILGLGIIAFGGVGAAKWEWPWYVVGGFVLVGATVWSGQVVTGALMSLLNPFKAFRRAWKDDAEPQ